MRMMETERERERERERGVRTGVGELILQCAQHVVWLLR